MTAVSISALVSAGEDVVAAVYASMGGGSVWAAGSRGKGLNNSAQHPNGPPADVAIARVAARQHGNITRAQLLSLGLARNAITYRVRIGRLYRVHRGVYAVGRPPRVPLERAAAAVLACGPGAALSDESAMCLWGLERRWPDTPHVTVPGERDRRPAGICVHRRGGLTRTDVRTQLGIRATSLARTLLDCAARQPPAGR